MRIRTDYYDIYEVKEVVIIPMGIPCKDNPNKYCDMRCEIKMRYGNSKNDVILGAFDCSNATSFEECEEIVSKFINELYENGKIDISTEEKCKEYGLFFI